VLPSLDLNAQSVGGETPLESTRNLMNCHSKRIITNFLFAVASALITPLYVPGDLISYQMVPVANPNSPADSTGYGAVAYSYWIGRYEVTVGQYATFLNAVGRTDTNGLYDPSMGTDTNNGRITRFGSSGSYSYQVEASRANRPVAYVSWFDAARFANWMSNGQPAGLQSAGTTENGAYAISGTASFAPARNAINPNTNAAPTFLIPTENEWYKAAYFSQLVRSGAGGYWPYPVQETLRSVSPAANFGSGSTTDVGSFGASFYGTYDQGGNLWEWNDLGGTAGALRGLRGGGYLSAEAIDLLSDTRFELGPAASEPLSVSGFRLVSPVPEPSTSVAVLVGVACAAWRLRRNVPR
jgi:sulfatase modifying factor 1